MKHKSLDFFKGILVLVFIQIAGSISGQTTYYISPAGNNSANGTSPGTAWQSISKVNSATIVGGDSVLFQAGGLWREELQVKPGISGTGNRVYYGRYNAGDNPKILGSVKAITWTATATPNIWQSATVVSNPRTGGWGYPGEVFFVTDDSTSWGIFEDYTAGYTNLDNEFEWTWNSNTLYVYSSTDPDTQYDDVEAVQRDLCAGFINDQSSYIEFNGIDLYYAKRAGYGNNSYPEANGQTNVTIRNCHISYIGVKAGACAYGIEAFHSNFLVENCTITDCGRRGISFNFYENHTPALEINNVIVRNNVFKRGQHTTSLDLAWVDANGANVQNVYFYNNSIDDSDITMTVNDEASNQVYIEADGTNLINLNIFNNVFIAATARNILVSGGQGVKVCNNTIFGSNVNTDSSPYGNVSFRNNQVNGLIDIDYRNNILVNNLIPTNLDCHGILVDYATAEFSHLDYNLYWQTQVITDRNIFGGYFGYYDINDWNTYRANLAPWDANSPTPANPLFVDESNRNFHLALNSSANGAGTLLPLVSVTDAHGLTDVINMHDIEGKPRSTTSPSIGAYEYPITDSSSSHLVYFTIPNQENSVVDTTNHTVVVTMPYGTNVTSLIPNIIVSDFASISPQSGVAQNFTNPVIYTVTSGDGAREVEYSVSVVYGDYCDVVSIVLNEVTTPDTNDLGNGTIRLTPTGGTAPYTYLWNNSATAATITDLNAGTYTVLVTDDSSCTQTGIFTVGQYDNRIFDSIFISPTLDWLDCPAPWIEMLASNTLYYSDTVAIRGIFPYFNNYGSFPITNYPDAVCQGYAYAENESVYLYVTNISSEYMYDIEVMSNRELAEVRNQYTIVNGDSVLIDAGDVENSIAYFEDVEPVKDSIVIQATNVSSIYSYINAVKIYVKYRTTALNTAANIVSFAIPSQIGNSEIDSVNHTVRVYIPDEMNYTSLTPTITISHGATIDPASGETVDFTNPVNYTVTAQDEITQQVWLVTVIAEDPYEVSNKEMSNRVKVFPNPASDHVFVKTELGSTIRIVNILGKVLVEYTTAEEISKVDFDFPSGIYGLQISKRDKLISTHKLIIQ